MAEPKESYLLIHQTGTLAYTDTLDLTIAGLAAIVDINSLEVYTEEGEWQAIPKGIETLEEADEELKEIEELEEELEELEDEEVVFSLGARRVISPSLVWKHCKG
jgi:hypothetical protein